MVAARYGWSAAYIACAAFALPAMLTALILGEPARRKVVAAKRSLGEIWSSIVGPFLEFFKRNGAWLVLLFILVHKIGDTLANLTSRLLFDDLGFTNDEIALYDVGVGFWAYLIGIFVGGWLYAQTGLKRSVLLSLILMGVWLAAAVVLLFPEVLPERMRGQVRGVGGSLGGVLALVFAAYNLVRWWAARSVTASRPRPNPLAPRYRDDPEPYEHNPELDFFRRDDERKD